MSIIGTHVVWWLDPAGAIAIATLILYSWVSTAFEQFPMLVGESAPQDFLNKCTYLGITHSDIITKIDTVRAYHSGQNYYVEMDVIMDENTPLKISHDVGQSLQRKLEGASSFITTLPFHP
jgi:divalent metal cation (Fe/Co/Zn/Cd) transporter